MRFILKTIVAAVMLAHGHEALQLNAKADSSAPTFKLSWVVPFFSNAWHIEKGEPITYKRVNETSHT